MTASDTSFELFQTEWDLSRSRQKTWVVFQSFWSWDIRLAVRSSGADKSRGIDFILAGCSLKAQKSRRHIRDSTAAFEQSFPRISRKPVPYKDGTWYFDRSRNPENMEAAHLYFEAPNSRSKHDGAPFTFWAEPRMVLQGEAFSHIYAVHQYLKRAKRTREREGIYWGQKRPETHIKRVPNLFWLLVWWLYVRVRSAEDFAAPDWATEER